MSRDPHADLPRRRFLKAGGALVIAFPLLEAFVYKFA